VIESYTNAILVEQPTPTDPNFIGEDNFFSLPYCQLPVSVSDQYHQRHGQRILGARLKKLPTGFWNMQTPLRGEAHPRGEIKTAREIHLQKRTNNEDRTPSGLP
jgi:hypothetical protein